MTKAGSFEGESSTDGIASGNVEELIKLRVQLDEELQNRFTKKMAVLFTDVEGSSAFFTTHGDVAGRIMLEKHNNLLFPIIEDHQGVIIKTIGDSIMASFNDPKMALKSAVVMQRKLVSYNQDRPRKSQIHIRISINFGDIIVEDNDIFGNVVNVTSRILSIAKPDHILISQTIYSVMIGTEGFAFRPISKVASLKGSEQITVYEVLWREDASAHESLSLMSLRVVNDGHDLEEGKVSTDKWAEGCFDLVIPILYRHTSRLVAKSEVELLSIFEDPVTPVEVAAEILEAVQNHNVGRPDEEAIKFQICVNTGAGIGSDREEDGVRDITDISSNFRAEFQPNEIYVTKNTYDVLRYWDQIEPDPRAVLSEGEAVLYHVTWAGSSNREDKRLFHLRKHVGAGNYSRCFYCGSRKHLVASCPSKAIWDNPDRLGELGHLSFESINALFTDHIDLITKPYEPTEQDDNAGRKPGVRNLAFDTFYELSSPFQLHFLRTILLSTAKGWSEIEQRPKGRPEGGALWLGLDCLRVSKLDQAEDFLTGEVKRYPNDHRVYTALGFFSIEKGNLAQALDYFEKAIRYADNILQKSYISLLTFRVHEVNNRLTQAKKQVEETLRIAPDCLEARYRKAVLMLKMGEYQRGVAELRTIISEESSFYVKTLLEPDLIMVEDEIESFLCQLFEEARVTAMENRPKAEETVEKLRSWFGVQNETDKDNRTNLEKIHSYIESDSYLGFVDAASLEENICYRGQMILQNHKNELRQKIASLTSSLRKGTSYIRNHPDRKKLGKLSFSLERISSEVSMASANVAFIETPEKFKESQRIMERLLAYSQQMEPVIRKLRTMEQIRLVFQASKRILLFVTGGLMAGSILFPLITYCMAYLFSGSDFVVERLWDYHKSAIFWGGMMGFTTGVITIVRNLLKGTKNYLS